MSAKTMLLALIVLLSSFCALDAIGSYCSHNGVGKDSRKAAAADGVGVADSGEWRLYNCEEEDVSPAASETRVAKTAKASAAAKQLKSKEFAKPVKTRQSLTAKIVNAVLPPLAGLLGFAGLGLLLRKWMLLRGRRSLIGNAVQLVASQSGPNAGRRRADSARRGLPLHVARSGLSPSQSSPNDAETAKDRKLRRAA